MSCWLEKAITSTPVQKLKSAFSTVKYQYKIIQKIVLTTESIQDKYNSLLPDEQQKFKRKVIYKLINENYGDRVSHFDVDKTPKPHSVASGSVTTPKLGGQSLVVDYSIGDNGVTLTPRNLSAISHGESQYYAALSLGFSFADLGNYVPLETYNFAKTLNCVKGWACGGSCLSKTKKNCLRPLDGEHKTYFDWLKTQVIAVAMYVRTYNYFDSLRNAIEHVLRLVS